MRVATSVTRSRMGEGNMSEVDEIKPRTPSDLLKDLRSRVDFHKRITRGASVAWMVAAFALTWGLPIFSGVVAWAAHENYHVFVFSLVLAILTAITAAIS